MLTKWKIIEWKSCYPSNWKDVVVNEAMTHPAKFSSKLIRKIYDHMLEENWVQTGDSVVDPFGGVALGALEAMRHGLHWTGVELEGGTKEIKTESKSFFRRLAEKKGSPRIDWEVVWCMQKPLDNSLPVSISLPQGVVNAS